jgi:hypothetical protein
MPVMTVVVRMFVSVKQSFVLVFVMVIVSEQQCHRHCQNR